MRAIVGVTEFKAEFTGMLNLHERFEFIYFSPFTTRGLPLTSKIVWRLTE